MYVYLKYACKLGFPRTFLHCEEHKLEMKLIK